MKKILLGLLLIFLIIGGIMIVNTLRFTSAQNLTILAEPERIDQAAAISRLTAAIRLKTISHQDPAQMDPVPFEAFQTLIQDSFAAIEKSVSQVFAGTAVSPGLVLAGTDSKHYTAISDNCYRFAPFVLGPEDPARIHGANERIPVQGYIRAIQYYCRLIKNAAGQEQP